VSTGWWKERPVGVKLGLEPPSFMGRIKFFMNANVKSTACQFECEGWGKYLNRQGTNH